MINDRGIWLDEEETKIHSFDEKLCKAIIKTIKGNKTVVDIGCGDGRYTKALIGAGFDCIGFDGSPLTPKITNGLCGIMDFSDPVDIGEYDVVLCLEVGEHIPKDYEQIFIDNICLATKGVIILSWAVEGQPGYGHVNCQNNDYVISEMSDRGFFYNFDKSEYLRKNSELWWFKDTTMYFKYETDF